MSNSSSSNLAGSTSSSKDPNAFVNSNNNSSANTNSMTVGDSSEVTNSPLLCNEAGFDSSSHGKKINLIHHVTKNVMGARDSEKRAIIQIVFACPLDSTTDSGLSLAFHKETNIIDIKTVLSQQHLLKPLIEDIKLIYHGKILDDTLTVADVIKGPLPADETVVTFLLALPSTYSKITSASKYHLTPIINKSEQPQIKTETYEVDSDFSSRLSKLIHSFSPQDGQLFLIDSVPFQYIKRESRVFLQKYDQPLPLICFQTSSSSYHHISTDQIQRPPEAQNAQRGPQRERTQTIIICIKLLLFFLLFTHDAGPGKVFLLLFIGVLVYLNQSGRLGIFHHQEERAQAERQANDRLTNAWRKFGRVMESFLSSLLPPPMRAEQ